MRRCIQVFLLLICATSTIPQAQSPSTNDPVESILGKMSPEEKIDHIGGTEFAIRALPGLQLTAFEMSDGPLGVRSNSRLPSTVYAAGIGLAATWNRSLAERVGGELHIHLMHHRVPKKRVLQVDWRDPLVFFTDVDI